VTACVFGGIADDIPELIKFMNGPDSIHLKEMVVFFSLDSRYLHPRELKLFWESLTPDERSYYQTAVFNQRRLREGGHRRFGIEDGEVEFEYDPT
jgi:hypothetical protein